MSGHFFSEADWENDGLSSAEWKMRLVELEIDLQGAESVLQDRHQDVARCKALLAQATANKARVRDEGTDSQ